MSEVNKACCSTPPVMVSGYEAKGKFIDMAGLKTYVSGSSDATIAILSIYDIFGFYPQTIQGADVLAFGDEMRPYQVIMPDFWEGNPALMEWYPPVTDTQKANMSEWWKNTSPDKHLPKVNAIIEAAGRMFPNVNTWGVLGYCWGGKMVSILGGQESVFKAGVQTSPAMVDPNEATNVKMPMCILPSKDENEEVISKYAANLNVPHMVETFKDQRHGFMSARGDLDDAQTMEEYERGYQLVLKWFREYL